LFVPNDESIVELFGNTKCRQIPWLSNLQTSVLYMIFKEEHVVYISIVIYVLQTLYLNESM